MSILPGCLDLYGWRAMKSAPRDGTHILACVVTPTENEDTGEHFEDQRICVVYRLGNAWMSYPAAPRFVLGQYLLAWQPLPPFIRVKSEAEQAHHYRGPI